MTLNDITPSDITPSDITPSDIALSDIALSDILGTLGVSILLIAFVLNQRRRLSEHSRAFLAMNLVGASICAYSAWLERFMPFVALESLWAVVAAWGLARWSPATED